MDIPMKPYDKDIDEIFRDAFIVMTIITVVIFILIII